MKTFDLILKFNWIQSYSKYFWCLIEFWQKKSLVNEIIENLNFKQIKNKFLGSIRNLSPQLWSMTHLTSLYLNDNSLCRIPADIARLTSLMHLDLSCNKLRSLPAELGDLIMLRELLLNNNYLRCLPYELGKLFQIQTLGEFKHFLSYSKTFCWLLIIYLFI